MAPHSSIDDAVIHAVGPSWAPTARQKEYLALQ